MATPHAAQTPANLGNVQVDRDTGEFKIEVDVHGGPEALAKAFAAAVEDYKNGIEKIPSVDFEAEFGTKALPTTSTANGRSIARALANSTGIALLSLLAACGGKSKSTPSLVVDQDSQGVQTELGVETKDITATRGSVLGASGIFAEMAVNGKPLQVFVSENESKGWHLESVEWQNPKNFHPLFGPQEITETNQAGEENWITFMDLAQFILDEAVKSDATAVIVQGSFKLRNTISRATVDVQVGPKQIILDDLNGQQKPGVRSQTAPGAFFGESLEVRDLDEHTKAALEAEQERKDAIRLQALEAMYNDSSVDMSQGLIDELGKLREKAEQKRLADLDAEFYGDK